MPDGAAIGPHRVLRRVTAARLGDAADPPGEDEAGRQALQVPFPGARRRLVEVIDIHHDPVIAGTVQPEIPSVRVTAQLCVQTAARPRGQVSGHQAGTSAEESERRGKHPPNPQGDQLRQPAPIACLHKLRHRGPGGGQDNVPVGPVPGNLTQSTPVRVNHFRVHPVA